MVDHRSTLTRSEARKVYDKFAASEQYATSSFGVNAIRALLSVAAFSEAQTVLDYGCGQCQLAELVLSQLYPRLLWHGVDQSPIMVQKAQERLRASFGSTRRYKIDLLEDGDPYSLLGGDRSRMMVQPKSIDRFVSTYCLDLLSEEDIYGVLDVAERVLHPDRGLLLLAGITWGYRGKESSLLTLITTLFWEILYIFCKKRVGGCRPQRLEPYLHKKGWTVVESIKTRPEKYPWMISEIIAAKPPSF